MVINNIADLFNRTEFVESLGTQKLIKNNMPTLIRLRKEKKTASIEMIALILHVACVD